jgi:DNA-3-methyladenine glycosylase I
MTDGLLPGPDGLPRCWWCVSDPLYLDYHDTEWGRPVADDRLLFEKLSLEGFQAGLSWLTILRKRDAFREVFAGFDIAAVATFGEADIDRLVGDARIVRHRGKIASVVNNARRTLEVIEEDGSLATLVWRYAPASDSRPPVIDRAALERMATTAESTALSRELKRRGFTFVGPTTAYAFMQAMGLVNDHVAGCWVRDEVGGVPAYG